jgi:hypothetical protein
VQKKSGSPHSQSDEYIQSDMSTLIPYVRYVHSFACIAARKGRKGRSTLNAPKRTFGSYPPYYPISPTAKSPRPKSCLQGRWPSFLTNAVYDGKTKRMIMGRLETAVITAAGVVVIRGVLALFKDVVAPDVEMDEWIQQNGMPLRGGWTPTSPAQDEM